MSCVRPLDRKRRAHSSRLPNFLHDHVAIHAHIEKTVGSTPTSGFWNALGHWRVRDIRGGRHEKPEAHSVEERDQIFVIAGLRVDLHRDKKPDLSSEDIGELKRGCDAANAMDAELVQFVETKYDRWIANLPARRSTLKCRRSS